MNRYGKSIHRLISATSRSKLHSVRNFSVINKRAASQGATNSSLLRSYLVYSTCQIPIIVNNAENILKLSYRVLGENFTDLLLRLTFFGHFCAGEDEVSIKPTVDFLHQYGIGSILDYAAESDVDGNNQDSSAIVGDNHDNSEVTSPSKEGVRCRVYDYKNEELCDLRRETFAKCIRAVKSVSPTGFAAIKCTALGHPELMKRASTALLEIRNLFSKFDEDNDGKVSKEQFIAAYNKFFQGGDVDAIFDEWDIEKDGVIDYIEWSNGLRLEDLQKITSFCKTKGPLSNAVLDNEELKLMTNMRKRIHSLAELAESLGVRVMIDAEHAYFQPLIDNITASLSKKHNTKYPAVFGTYQMYLKDSHQRLFTDIERAKKGQYKFAAKLVRGAYMLFERSYAAEMGLQDPIQPDIQATHDNYNRSVREIIERISNGEPLEIMIASHNCKSVELALDAMKDFKLDPSAPVYFGQLLGMSDYLTFSLGRSGYKAYKYVPYGRVHEVMPYLIRRAQENADALSGAKTELDILSKEIKSRFFGESK